MEIGEKEDHCAPVSFLSLSLMSLIALRYDDSDCTYRESALVINTRPAVDGIKSVAVATLYGWMEIVVVYDSQ